MNNVELMIEEQHTIALSNLLTWFKSDVVLGRRHSLADCDFIDSNRCFPEEWAECASRAINPIPQYWYESDRKIAFEQIQKQYVLFKEIRWDQVSVEYIKKYQSGFFYMEPEEFKFYLAAFLFQLLNNRPDMEGYSDRFFDFFLNKYREGINGWFASLNEQQIESVIDVMIYVAMGKSCCSFSAKKSFEALWDQGFSYGKERWGKFCQEKMIQDFIDKG